MKLVSSKFTKLDYQQKVKIIYMKQHLIEVFVAAYGSSVLWKGIINKKVKISKNDRKKFVYSAMDIKMDHDLE
uniref:Uncharacterized protein n=1 Tax=Panagrolaimus sp. ES5 TaxID=591445 RepID=A0AC34FDJ8_9BILA